MSCIPGVTRGIERIRCNVVIWHDVIWGGMTCRLDTWHDADLMWMTGNGHGARICGDDRWYVGFWVFLEMKAASLFRLHESEV
jgi:hypothetical protein